jgi:CyaY protein
MTDPEFLDHAESLLRALEQQCDRFNDHTDALTFSNRSQIIVNLQKPLHEVWLAARSGGYHYRFDGQQWMDTKGQGEFWAQLSRDATAQAGVPLAFSS